jgi:DNA replication protein DnaC
MRNDEMMMHTTLAQLRSLKLDGLAAGLEEQLAQPGMAALSFEERVALLIDREVHARNDRKLVRLLKNAHLKYGQAAIEDIDTRSGRGIDRREVMSLALGDWVSAGHSVLITGPTGAGKSWLACALAQYACRRGYSAIYQRVPRLQEELRIRHGSGAFGKWLLQLAKTDVLVLDDWGMGAIDSMTRSDLLRSSTTARAIRQPSSPASSRSNTGMPGSATPPSPTPSWIASCSAITASR